MDQATEADLKKIGTTVIPYYMGQLRHNQGKGPASASHSEEVVRQV